MPVMTASKEGCRNYNSLCIPSASMSTIDVRLSGIVLGDITEAVYQLGDNRSSASKTISGGGIIVGDDGLIVTLLSDDVKGSGRYNHYLEITDLTGTYKASLNFGRMNIQ